LYRRVVPLIRNALGPSHPNTLLSINDLASLLLGREKYEEAAPLYQELIEGSRHAPERWQRYVPVFEGGLGRCLTAMGRYDEAEKYLLNAYRTQSARAGDDDEDSRIYLERLAVLYDAWDKPDKAREYRSRLEAERGGH
jgi:tetratricopeptide (TPR) repeat protein